MVALERDICFNMLLPQRDIHKQTAGYLRSFATFRLGTTISLKRGT